MGGIARRVAAAALLALLFAALCSVASAASPDAGTGTGPSAASIAPGAPADRAIVLVESPQSAPGPSTGSQTGLGRTRARIGSVVSDARLEAVERLPEIGAVAVDPPEGESVADLRRSLADDRRVVAVERDRRLALRFVPDDPAFGAIDIRAPRDDRFQWHLRGERFTQAWSRSRGRGVLVAVIDTGADGDHPDLTDRIAFAADKRACPFPCVSPSPGGPRTDEIGHGTHVSGLACAHANNGYGIASAGFRCNLLVFKTDLSRSSIAESITEASDRDADVINMSFGGGGRSRTIERALDYAFDRDVILIASASNDDTTDQGIPARYLQPPGTGPKLRRGKGLVVTAAEYDGSRAWFRPGRGNGISMAAFGAASRNRQGIFSTFPANETEIERGSVADGIPPCPACRGEFRGDPRFGYLEGTSMASPQVSGAAALMRAARPGISNRRAIRVLKRSAREQEFDRALGWGLLNANRAVRTALRD